MSQITTDSEIAAAAVDALGNGRLVIMSADGDHREVVELPNSIQELVLDALDHARRGESVRVFTDDEEITTGQAADILNVSRPYLVGLVDAGQIPFRKVGTRRRLRLIDVLRYRDIDNARQHRAARDLADEAQKLGLY